MAKREAKRRRNAAPKSGQASKLMYVNRVVVTGSTRICDTFRVSKNSY